MKILVIGDQHIAGFGLPAGQVGFVGHFVRQISRAGQAVTLEAHSQTSLAELFALLTRLPLDSYDLIIWQTGEGCLSVPTVSERRLVSAGQWLMQRLRSQLPHGFTPATTPVDLSEVLQLLRPQRHKVLIMTPVPQQNKRVQWWREQGRHCLLREGDEQGLSVFDTGRHIRPVMEYFLDYSPTFLNAVSHELIGRALFDFYQATPTIVAIRSKN